MTVALRERQTELTRSLIMQALSELVAAEGVHDFSIQEVADRSGVSHRTVYRHFPNREALLEALASWLDEQIVERGGVSAPEELGELPSALNQNFRIFEELGPLVRALAVLSIGARLQLPTRSARTRRFLDAVQRAVPHLDEDEAEAVAVMLRLIASSTAWYQLRDQHGLDAERARRVATWAIDCLVEALEAGGGPNAGIGPPAPASEYGET